ncbi:MAG: hypothetical protein A2516_09700 [Alphaproteobacteria bacterium RIFOXYD12_FULL_60_8]|nr:MAG: hypothetical protein A2516_09700 [Alphaproteobacteria bacterium RIFOXYD12_FULL_60_8]
MKHVVFTLGKISKSAFLRTILFVSLGVAILIPLADRILIYPMFIDLQVRNVEEEAARVAAHLASHVELPSEGLSRQNLPTDLVVTTAGAKKSLELWKARIFSPSGEILFSTEPPEIGTINKAAYFFERVAKGEKFTTVVKKNKKTLEGDVADIDVVETYVPLLKDGQFLGAFEIYYDITQAVERLNRVVVLSSVLIAVLGATLFLAVCWALFKASKAIDERLRVELELRQAHKMKALGTLAGGVSHEFNNMLLPIIALTELTLNDLPQDGREAKRLRKVLQAADRAKKLVEQILTFSRQSMDNLELHNLYEVVAKFAGLLGASLPPTVSVTTDLDPKAGMVFVDPVQVETVLMNLAVNAAHAMEGKNGSIHVTLARVELDEARIRQMGVEIEPGPYAELRVGDTGRGMDTSTMERIFDPFFTTKPVGQGTGLGLSMIKGIVTGYEGAIYVESELGKGSTFFIYLPLEQVV